MYRFTIKRKNKKGKNYTLFINTQTNKWPKRNEINQSSMFVHCIVNFSCLGNNKKSFNKPSFIFEVTKQMISFYFY